MSKGLDMDVEKEPRLPDAVEVSLPQGSRQKRTPRVLMFNFCIWALTMYAYARLFFSNVPTYRGLHVSQSWALDAFSIGSPRDPADGVHPALKADKREKLFLSTPNKHSALAASRAYATHPHIAGSVEDFHDALEILALFEAHFGIKKPTELPVFSAGSDASRSATLSVNKLKSPSAWVDIYFPVMNTPVSNGLEVLGDNGAVEWTADLTEDGDPGDPDAAKYRDFIPTFHGLSHDGEAEGQLIYANYGRYEDYEKVLAAGGNFTSKIVLVRYGQVFRGLKIKRAEELGAAGVLIYSDPRDDGSVTVENGYAPYPLGPARNPTSVQRGSVQYISKYPGDPTTPGYPAYPNATRTEGENIPQIPSLPISWSNARRLLEEIEESGEPLMRGRASKKKVKLINHVDTKVMPIWNVMAAIPGHIKNETVVIGCHRDAWVMGAADPTSGTVSLHEIIRGYGVLLRSGWKPLRNVVFASWDAEEYGLIGSTEWAEDFADWITGNVVAYLNTDVSSSGSIWEVEGSPSLAHLIRKAAQDVPHPTIPGKTLWDAIDDEGPFYGPVDPEFMATYSESRKRLATETGIELLGSGSDFTPFLQRLGVASMNEGFGQALSDAPYHYHSIYDTQRWQELYADPGFGRHVAVAQHLGLVGLRLIDAIVLPLNTTQYSFELEDYLNQVESIASSLSLNPDFSGLHKSIVNLQSKSNELDAEKAKAESSFKKLLKKCERHPKSCRPSAVQSFIRWPLRVLGFDIAENRFEKFVKAAKRVQTVNAKLVAFERGFISEGGIKDREWYRHLVVAPGKWLGYGATTLPAVTEALTFDNNVTMAEAESHRVADLIDKLADVISV
ncbi:Zn-dependent exopeptidase [Obba rivulosa]|uniref:Zn-dependent exopeptidase n=1 Tax=Obba rivulosa TaxID=1052685 RepID=A0A8E2DRA5_9APHY|nr:Zn-dependent exopeptidase [Obba rivulosa]